MKNNNSERKATGNLELTDCIIKTNVRFVWVQGFGGWSENKKVIRWQKLRASFIVIFWQVYKPRKVPQSRRLPKEYSLGTTQKRKRTRELLWRKGNYKFRWWRSGEWQGELQSQSKAAPQVLVVMRFLLFMTSRSFTGMHLRHAVNG